MAKLNHTVWINRPIEEVFAFAADQDRLTEWQPGLVEAAFTSEASSGVGATFRSVAEMYGQRVETSGVITAYEQNKAFSYESSSGPVDNSGTFSFAEERGGTLVAFAGDLKLRGVLKAAGPLIESAMNEHFGRSLHQLKEVLEAGAGAS